MNEHHETLASRVQFYLEQSQDHIDSALAMLTVLKDEVRMRLEIVKGPGIVPMVDVHNFAALVDTYNVTVPYAEGMKITLGKARDAVEEVAEKV